MLYRLKMMRENPLDIEKNLRDKIASSDDYSLSINISNNSPNLIKGVDKQLLLQQLLNTVGILVYFLCIYFATSVNPNKIFFIETDPRISFPYMTSQVSVVALVSISSLVPAFFITICTVFIPESILVNVVYSKRSKILIYTHLGCGLLQTLLLTDAVTNTIKIMVLRPRPNFLAYCNYMGYRDAMSSNNYTTYDSLVHAGTVGLWSNCREQDIDSILSFPSGHSSFSFAGMMFTAMMFRFFIDFFHNFRFIGVDGILFIAPLLISSWIAITRIQDHFHHEDDVIMGSMIGIIVSFYTFRSCEYYLNHYLQKNQGK